MSTPGDTADAVRSDAAAAAAAAAADRLIVGGGTPEQAWRESRALAASQALSVEALMRDAARLVVVAPHPDDETLGVGGLIAQWSRQGGRTLVLALTDGEASHPGSPRWPPGRLAAARRIEQRDALGRLGQDAEPMGLRAARLPDGALAGAQDRAQAFVAAWLRPGDRVLATWRLDGHPDHEAAGRAAAGACAQHGIDLIEYPVWAWHWAAPEDRRIPWARLRRVPLDQAAWQAKRAAAAMFASQIEPDVSTGQAPIVDAGALRRLLRPFETVILP